MALIFAWTGGIRKRGELDKTPDVVDFANKLDAASLETIESGIMTNDLALAATPNKNNKVVMTEDFIGAIRKNLDKKLKVT